MLYSSIPGESEVEFDRQSFFTVEEAVEKIGFGFFQIKLICICGLFTVSINSFPSMMWILVVLVL